MEKDLILLILTLSFTFLFVLIQIILQIVSKISDKLDELDSMFIKSIKDKKLELLDLSLEPDDIFSNNKIYDKVEQYSKEIIKINKVIYDVESYKEFIDSALKKNILALMLLLALAFVFYFNSSSILLYDILICGIILLYHLYIISKCFSIIKEIRKLERYWK